MRHDKAFKFPVAKRRAVRHAAADAILSLEKRVLFAVFNTGDLAVYRTGAVGSGAALTNAATAVFVDEYTASGGSPVQSIALPTVPGTGSTINPLTTAGSSANEGLMTLSADGKYLLVPGYNAVPGVQAVAGLAASVTGTITGATNASPIVVTASAPFSVSQFNGSSVKITSVVGNTAADGTFYAKAVGTPTNTTTFALYQDPAFTIPVAGNAAYTSGGSFAGGVQREIGRIDGAGTIDTTTTLGTAAFSAGSIRGAASADGTSLYASGSNTGLVSQTFGSTTNATIASSGTSTLTNLRATEVYNGTVYVSTGSGTTRFDLLNVSTLMALPGLSSTTYGANPNEFAFASLGGTSNPDTLYTLEQAAGVQKFSLVGGTWTLTGTVAVAGSPTGIAARNVGGVEQIFVSSPTAIYSLSDSSGFNGTLTGTATSIATASANTAFRGIAFAPTAPVITPVVTSIAPTVGSTSGGTSVTITGNGFSTITGVNFGGVAATSFVVNSYNSITAVAPAGSAGAVDVTVVNSVGTSATSAGDQFTYTVAPTVASVSPNAGPSAGGTVVTITGSNFTSPATVKFGTAAATSVTVNSATSITATAPAGTGPVDVTVTSGGATSGTTTGDLFTYVAAPTITGLDITSGLDGGGKVLTITGTGFVNVTGVSFGGTPGTAVTVTNSTTLKVTTPAHAVGTVDVVVSAAGGTSSTSASDQFTFVLTTIAAAEAQPTGTILTIDSNPVVTSVLETAGETAFDSVGNTNSYTRSAFFVQDSTGSVQIFFTATTATPPPPSYTPTVGDVITSVTGTWSPFNQLPELGTITAITASGTGSVTTPPPTSTIPTLKVTTLPNNIAGYIFTLKGVDISPTITGSATTFVKTSLTGTITDTSGNSMTLFYSVSNNALAYKNLGDTAIPFNKLLDMTGYVDVSSGTARFNILSLAPSTVAPVVSSVTPSSGATTGTNSVVIKGFGFTNAGGVSSVLFGANASTSFTVDNDGQITAVVPAGSAGAVDIKVVNGNGTSVASSGDLYTYTVAPVVSVLSPNGAPTTGGTAVTITGGNFTGATSVTFGGTAVAFSVVDDQHITTTAPAHAAGTVDVVVTKGTASSPATASSKFTFTVLAAVTGITPTTGPDIGGTSVTITGSGFNGTTSVTFGSVAAASFTVNSDTSITAVTPATTAGVVDVQVINPAGTSAAVAADQFTFSGATIAVAESVAPGTSVTIESNPVVTAILSRGGTSNNDLAYANWAFLVQDATGSIEIFGPLTGLNYTPTVGDTISVTGLYSPFDQIPEIGGAAATAITALTKTGTSSVIPGQPIPLQKTISQVNGGTLPLTVGGYEVTLNNVTISNVPGGATTFGSTQISATLTDSTGTMTFFYDPKNYSIAYDNFFGTTIPTGPVSLTGIIQVFGTGTPTAEFLPISVAVPVTLPAWLSSDSVATYSHTNGTISVTSGTIIGDPSSTSDGNIAITVTGSLNTNLSSGAAIHVGSVNISSGATFTLRPSSTTLSPTKPILLTSGLTIASTGKLDLANGFIDLIGGNETAAFSLVKLGFANGAWTGTGGIYSSVAAGNSTKLTAIGVSTATAAGTLDTAAYAAGDVLLKYTYYGDADLSGNVDGSDYSRIDAAFLAGGKTGWFNGDFNYDGAINGSDYTLIDNAFNSQGTAFPSAIVASPAVHPAVAAPVGTASTDAFFSDKKVKVGTLISEVEDLITG